MYISMDLVIPTNPHQGRIVEYENNLNCKITFTLGLPSTKQSYFPKNKKECLNNQCKISILYDEGNYLPNENLTLL
jgi:hypothetical protein